MSVGGPEVELLADGAASEAARARRHAAPPGTPCHNCGTALQGPWCHACGQKADDFHRSIWHLVAEAFEGLTHFDGRVWTTLVRLVRRPGTLTREFVEGRRASQLPPFRLFLIMVVVVFFVGGASVRSVEQAREGAAPGGQRPASVNLGGDTTFQVSVAKPGAAKKAVTFDERKSKAFDDAVESWSHQFALLSVLILAPVVSLLFRRRYFFDHLIFSLHSLSFQGAVFTGALLLRAVHVPQSQLLFLAIPAHVFFHLRGAYRLKAWSALWRTAAMLFGQTVGLILLMIGLVLVGVAATR